MDPGPLVMTPSVPIPMNRRSFPTGQTTTALLKALLRTLSAEKGTAVADAWLRGIRMIRDDLEDETRLLPLPTMHGALASFVDAASRESIARAAKYLVAPDGLGIWVRVLRGTTEPAEAFARLDAADSQYGRTTRWETLDTRRGWWRGRVLIVHDPSLEQDGLLRLGRLAELAAVPALFGYPDAVARSLPDAENRSASMVQEFEVSWSVSNATSHGAIGAAVGLAVGVVPLCLHHGAPELSALFALFAAATGGLAGVMRAREALRRAETYAQQARVHALERSLSLRESNEGAAAGRLEGTVVAGQYRILRRMGSGATGVIYEAARISDGLPVAIKLLRAAAAHEAVASDRLRREAEALGLAWHPNVVEVIDHGYLPDGTAYLVMELLPGESLASRLQSKGKLSTRELLPIAMQLCDALGAVHAAGVVHRDVKPSNVYLSIDREDPSGIERVKLLDFGIARVEWEETRITHTGGPLGTTGYMAPEQEVGSPEVDGRSDLFSLGAVIYECLVGEPPPPRSASGLVRTSAAFRLDPSVHEAAALIPPAWRAVIEKALAPNPGDRFQDARAFANALRSVSEEVAGLEASS